MISTKYFLSRRLSWCLWTFLILTSCASWKTDRMSLSTNKRLSREIVARKIADHIKYGNESVFFVDPLLKERADVFNTGEFLPTNKLLPDLFYLERQQYSFPFVIPDSLLYKVKYIDEKLDVENGPGTFFLFSPLLPTKKKDVFAMQVYRFYTSVEGLPKGDSLRYASRNYDLYTIKKRHAHYLETISAPEDFFNLPLLRIK